LLTVISALSMMNFHTR